MSEIILGLLGYTVGVLLAHRSIRRREKKKELKAAWAARDLEHADREANKKLYELDPALAVELGYEPPKEKPREVETPTGIPGETVSNPFQNLLAPGLKQAVTEQQRDLFAKWHKQVAEQQRQAGYFDAQQIRQQSSMGPAGHLLGGLLGSYGQRAECICGAFASLHGHGAACPKYRGH